MRGFWHTRHRGWKRVATLLVSVAMVLDLFWPYVQAWAESTDAGLWSEELMATLDGSDSDNEEAATGADSSEADKIEGADQADSQVRVDQKKEDAGASNNTSVVSDDNADDAASADGPFTLRYKDKDVSAEATLSEDAQFSKSGRSVDADDVSLNIVEGDEKLFAKLCDEPGVQLQVLEVQLCDEREAEVKQVDGEMDLTLKVELPEVEPEAKMSEVEVYQLNEDAKRPEDRVELVPDKLVMCDEDSVSIDGDSTGTYALRYTVDYYYNGEEYHMPGGTRMLLSELFDTLKIEQDAADVKTIDFTKPTVLEFERYEDKSDWVIQSKGAFTTQETLTCVFENGYRLEIDVTDAGEGYSESRNLGDFLTFWSLTVGDTTYTDENVDENTVIVFKDGMQYSLELRFAERPDLGFETPSTDPQPMFYQLPDCFKVPDDFTMMLNVNLGRKGTLPDNMITVYHDTDTNGKEHTYLQLTWNWKDSHWAYFRDSAQAKLTIVASGTFRDQDPNVLSINGKDVAIRKEDLHNAIVNKEGVFDRGTGVITYTVTVSSDGTTSDITLTDTLGSALYYLGDIVYDEASSTNTAHTTPQIAARTGNTFNVVIPAMNDGDRHVFIYSARVDYDAIAISGSPSFEETGNTAQIFGDSYTLDNKAMYHETNIDFSDLEKNVVNKRRETIDGKYCYILSWEIETNKRAQYPLADTNITDTISPSIASFSKYYGDGLTIKCYSDSGVLQDTRQVSWEDLSLDLANDTSWTYHIPDTDPLYRYVLTYDTIVDMSAQTETVVAENTAEGKGGIDNDRAVLTVPGTAGIGVTKRATNVDSTHVTWEITLTVSGASLNYQRLVLAEHSGRKTYTENGVEKVTWSSDYLPARWIEKHVAQDGTEQRGRWYKEKLIKAEVIGLEGDETFKVTYGREGNYARTDFVPNPGENVIEKDFAGESPGTSELWGADFCQLEFYKDAECSQGGLTNPGGESPSRTLTIRLTTEFPELWATAARDYTRSTSSMYDVIFSHINWIEVQTPDNSGQLVRRAYDTDKIEPMPPQIYKTVLENADTTTSPDNQKQKWLRNFPNCIVGNYNSLDINKPEYKDMPLFPVFRYQVCVTGIKYDEPLVIEDSFDTSLFQLLTVEDFPGGMGILGNNAKIWSHNYFMKVFGSKNYGWIGSGQSNYDGTEPDYATYGIGYLNKNYYRKAEDYGCTLELTDSGFRVTISSLFRDPNGELFPYYGVDYYLIPKSLEALKQIEEMARANAKAGGESKASFTNTATARGSTANATIKIGITNDFMPIDKTSETYLDLLAPYQGQTRIKLEETQMGNQTVRDTPDGINANNIQRYVMKYRIVLNKGKERLNDGNEITAEDEYSSNLAVDFTSINITTEPASAASQVSYDYSGNVGYFTIPDETKVVIEYEAVVLQTTAAVVPTSNEVRMLQYKKTVDDYVDHGGASGSSATNPAILVKKYGSGHMEKGLNGAQFQLFEYNHTTYTRGDSNKAEDWTPVVLTKPDTHYAIYETHDLTVGDHHYGNGYAEIELRQDTDGTTLQTGKVYGLREIKTPTSTASNGDVINYQNPHDDNFYCYIFSICGDGGTADYSNYVYLPDDTMTVRNTPESIALHLSKQLTGNCNLSDSEKAQLTYQVFRKEVPEEGRAAIYMPIMTEEKDPTTGQDVTVVDSRFTGIRYNDIAESDGVELTGLTVTSGTTVGEYLLVEYGNDTIRASHPDWKWNGTYEWNNGQRGTFSTSKAYTVHDQNGQNPLQVYGVPFTVTSQEIKDSENKSVVLTNRYTIETVDLTAQKRWVGPSGSSVAWPPGKSVTFQLGILDENGVFTANPLKLPVTLDNQKDDNGEDVAGSAVFRNLPKYRVETTTVTTAEGTKETTTLATIRYAVRETSTVSGYDAVYPVQPYDYAAFSGSATTVTIKNQLQSTSVSASKRWDKDIEPANASATFRLYSYTDGNPSSATWVSNVNDITLDGTVDAGDGTFGEKTAWQADFTGLPIYDSNGQQLTYIVKEDSCTPSGYEPVEEYAGNGGTITNKPASTTFTVSKRWSGTSGGAWPAGVKITLALHRKTPSGTEDNNFSASYVLTKDGIVSQTPILNPYGESVEAGTWTGGKLTVNSLQKYDSQGNEWRYYVEETAIQNADDEDLSGIYTATYRDKNNYVQSTAYTYSGGSITNIPSTKELKVQKLVAGNMGDKTKPFTFTVTLTKGTNALSGQVSYEKVSGGTTTSGTITFISGSASFDLKHGESIKLLNLQGGYDYVIEETAAGYEPSWVASDGTSGNTKRTEGTLSSNLDITFTNTRQTLIPLGVNSEGGGVAAAALAMLAVAIAAAAARLYDRRKQGKLSG